MTVSVSITQAFEKMLKKLPPHRQAAVVRGLLKFESDPNYPSLHMRPVSGHDGHWIINGHHGDRIILRETGPEEYVAVRVGPHDNVYRHLRR